ncbi:hypothetical protein K2X14_16190 [Acetobacter sp. TBRC 12305]|uniref:Uncharacterized protein n=1 Tax=Acetobacter garciniae TaxID=2817435 RepID=A0A939KR51_9PROT|nr:hypothetical protein [Acetobacter garciniae]MBO1326322.1 hypothetical protein [Acetobacter garciniae]MBX0346372.1 hypothetical protein [Acetobacter garciniae]
MALSAWSFLGETENVHHSFAAVCPLNHAEITRDTIEKLTVKSKGLHVRLDHERVCAAMAAWSGY